MKVYRFFSDIRLFKSYTAKVMFIAFTGIYIPLLSIIGILLFVPGSILNKISIILLTVGFTIMASVVTMYLIYALIAPVRKVQVSLTAYLKYNGMPNLPEHFDDELGLLMRTVNSFVSTVNCSLIEKDRQIKSLSRDMRAPAANILTQINLLRAESDPAEIEKHLRDIDASVNRQLKLMDGMVYSNDDKINNRPQRLKSRSAANKPQKVLL